MKFKVHNPTKLIPNGTYYAQVKDIETKTIYQKKTLIVWFLITGGEYDGISVRGFINVQYEAFSEQTKLHQWLKKSIGTEFDENDELDTDNFFDRILEVQIEEKESKKTKNLFSNVVDIIRLVEVL